MKKSDRKSRRRKIVRKAIPIIWKTSAILAVAAGVGLSMLGPERYSAIATELLPRLSLAAKTTLKSTTNPNTASQTKLPHQLYHFSMSVTGGQATIPGLANYRRFEALLTTEGDEPRVILRLQQIGGYQPVYEYEQALSQDEFSEVWQQLRALEVAQLTNLSPYTEDQSKAAGRIAIAPAPSATYQFEFKDGVHDYPNSFEVHAPEQLSDGRYQALRDVMFEVIVEQFGDAVNP